MFSWIWNQLRSLFGSILDNIIVPLWTVLRGMWTWLVGVVLFVVTFIRDVCNFISDVFTGILTAIGGLFFNLSQPGWASVGSYLDFANTFFPVSECFAMVSVWLALVSSVILLRWYRMLRDLLPL